MLILAELLSEQKILQPSISKFTQVQKKFFVQICRVDKQKSTWFESNFCVYVHHYNTVSKKKSETVECLNFASDGTLMLSTQLNLY